MLRSITYKTLIISVAMLVAAQLVFSSSAPIVSADPLPTDWMDTSANPSLEPQFTVDSATYNENAKKPYEECTQKTFITRPARPGQSQQTKSGCWHDTSIGWVYQNYAVAKGENIAGPIDGRTYGDSTRNWFLPTPNPNIILDRWTNSVSDNYKFRFNPLLTKTTNSNGTVKYQFTYGDSLLLKHENGNSLSGFDISYSENGRYATATRNTSMSRIDLQTKKILRYGGLNSSYTGTNLGTVASITSDGTLAVVKVTGYVANKWMKVFDLTDCQDVEYDYVASDHANCASRDFTAFISASIPSFNSYSTGQFLDNNTIAFYHNNGSNPATYTQYLMSIGGSGGKKYMALGDSIASGEGAYDYVYPTDEGEDVNNCHTSENSYPYLIENTISLDAFSSFACSGARIVNIVGANGVRENPEEDPFSDNQYYDEDYKTTFYWSPGYERQIQKVMDQKPNIVTINVTANDIGFAEKLALCLGPGTCFSSYEERKELANEINSVFNKSYRTFSRLKSVAATKAKVYVVGYPKYMNPSGACMPNVQLNADELQLANDFVSRLNLVIAAAAEKAGVFYADVEDAFNGSRHCEGGVGNVAANGITAGNDIAIFDKKVIGNETYHPNQLGHRKLRDAILTATGSFTAAMPAPDSSVTAPSIDDSIPLLVNATKANRPLRSLYYDKEMLEDIVYKADGFNASIKGSNANTKSGSSYQAEIHSTPISLGTFTSDDNGDINISTPVPSGLDPGFHTLHIYGKDMNNQDMDIYKTIYVAESEEDWDGNGIDNDEDPCLIVDPSGVDVDEDGIDDACDPIIGNIPPEEEEEQAYNFNLNSDSNIIAVEPLKYKKPDEYISA